MLETVLTARKYPSASFERGQNHWKCHAEEVHLHSHRLGGCNRLVNCDRCISIFYSGGHLLLRGSSLFDSTRMLYHGLGYREVGSALILLFCYGFHHRGRFWGSSHKNSERVVVQIALQDVAIVFHWQGCAVTHCCQRRQKEKPSLHCDFWMDGQLQIFQRNFRSCSPRAGRCGLRRKPS
jgi:hypothetical protein